MVALVGAATYYTATVIVKVLVAATGKGKRGRNRADLNYDALGQAAFGRPGQLLSGGVQIAELSLAAVAILCLLGDNLAQLSGARSRSTCRLAQLCSGPTPALAPHLVLDPRPTPSPDRRACPTLTGGALDVTRGVLLASGVSYLLCVTRRVELQPLVYPSEMIAGAPPVVPAPCSASQCSASPEPTYSRTHS